MRIHKYLIHPGHVPPGWDLSLEMPTGAEIVHSVGEQEAIKIWAKVDPELPMVKRTFTILCTGQDIPDNAIHVSTWLDEPFDWHLFEVAS